MSKFWCYDIVDDSKVSVGSYEAQVAYKLDEIFPPETDSSFFDPYLARMPEALTFPCAVLKRIIVYEEFEGKGHGSRALKHFATEAKSLGCKHALVRVGWSDDNKEKNLHFYIKNGWISLFKDFEVPLMYHPL